MAARTRQRLETLLSIEEILGAAVFDATGRVEAVVNLGDRDAGELFAALQAAIGGAATSVGAASAFAAFTLSEGQVAICADRRRATIALADPGLDALLLKSLLADLLADLAAAPEGPSPTGGATNAAPRR